MFGLTLSQTCYKTIFLTITDSKRAGKLRNIVHFTKAKFDTIYNRLLPSKLNNKLTLTDRKIWAELK